MAENTQDQAQVDPKAAARWAAQQKLDEAQKILEDAGIERADPVKSKTIENEIASAIDLRTGDVYVSNVQPGKRYAWVFRDPHNEFAGVYVHRMLALGWERVCGEMPEAREHMHVDGSRVVADCILLRTSEENYHKLEQVRRLKRLRQQQGAAADLYDLARECGVRVRNIEEMEEVGDALKQRAEAETQKRAQNRVAGPPNIRSSARRTVVPGIPSSGA